MMRRMLRPGPLGTMACTTVVVGTAAVTANALARRGRAQQRLLG